MKNISKLAVTGFFLLALCGCHKDRAATPVVSSELVECASSLRYIAAAKEAWAKNSGAASNDTPTWDDLKRYLPRGGIPRCAGKGTYTIGTVGELPKCSIASHNEYFRTNQAPPP